MEQVYVREKQSNGDVVKHAAQVVSRNGENLRVKIYTRANVSEVLAADTEPITSTYMLNGTGGRQMTLPQQQFPTSLGALANRSRA